MEPEKKGKVLFAETVRPPLWLLAFIFFLLASVALSIWAAFDDRSALITLGLGVLAMFFINEALSMKITVDEEELHVERAHIDRKYLGKAQTLSINEMRLTRGRDADPTAYLAIRFWQPRGIKVSVKDDRDLTPYWLISSKKAKDLADTLNAITNVLGS